MRRGKKRDAIAAEKLPDEACAGTLPEELSDGACAGTLSETLSDGACGIPMSEELTEELLLEKIRIVLKDYFVASIRKAGDELRIRFAGGETYCLTVWKQSSQKGRGRGAHMRTNETNFGEGACPNSSAAKCVGDSCADVPSAQCGEKGE